MRSIKVAVFLTALGALAKPEPATAQCGRQCNECVSGFYIVTSDIGQPPDGSWVETVGCKPWTCVSCGGVTDDSDVVVNAAIARRIRRGELTDVPALSAAFGDRLLVEPNRNLVLILGGCDGRTVEAVVVATPTMVAHLRRAGVAGYSEYLMAST